MSAACKTCPCCSKAIRGRIDKKFCSDACRSTYHNGLQSARTNMRLVNHILQKNHRILERLVEGTKTNARITRNGLLLQGFNFRYFTHHDTNRKGQKICCCYGIGYRIVKETVIITRKNT